MSSQPDASSAIPMSAVHAHPGTHKKSSSNPAAAITAPTAINPVPPCL